MSLSRHTRRSGRDEILTVEDWAEIRRLHFAEGLTSGPSESAWASPARPCGPQFGRPAPRAYRRRSRPSLWIPLSSSRRRPGRQISSSYGDSSSRSSGHLDGRDSSAIAALARNLVVQAIDRAAIANLGDCVPDDRQAPTDRVGKTLPRSEWGPDVLPLTPTRDAPTPLDAMPPQRSNQQGDAAFSPLGHLPDPGQVHDLGLIRQSLELVPEAVAVEDLVEVLGQRPEALANHINRY